MARVIPEGMLGGALATVDRESPPELDEFVRRAESEAKRRLARELHDSVAQTLTLMVVDMEQFKRDVADEPALFTGIDRMQESARQVLGNLRQVLCELREEEMIDPGLVRHVRGLLQRLQSATGIRARLSVSRGWPSRLSRVTSQNLGRIVEEALNNVRLHSTGNQVEVQLDASGSNMVVAVRDNGGPWSGGERRSGMGLIGMRERAILLGGRLDVTSGDGEGTTVRVVVPRAAGTPRTWS